MPNLTLNFGSAGSGRYRLYSPQVCPAVLLRAFFSLSITTQLAGLYFCLAASFLPSVLSSFDHCWHIDEGTLRILGIVLLLIIAVLCGLRLCEAAACDDGTRNCCCRHMIRAGANGDLQNWMAMGAIICADGSGCELFLCAGRTAGEGSIAGTSSLYSGRHRRAGGRIPCVAGGRTYVAGTIIAALLAYRVLLLFYSLLLALVC